MTFWNRIKRVIKEQNTTQEWIAKKSGVSYHTFAGWITKKRIPDVYQAYSIAKTLGVTVEYLVDGDAGDAYVRDVLGLPAIAPEKRDLIRKILELPEADLEEIRLLVALKHNRMGALAKEA